MTPKAARPKESRRSSFREYSRLQPEQFINCEVEVATDPDKKVVTANGQTTTTYPTDGAVTYKWTATSSVPGGATGTFANDIAASTTWTAPTTAGIYTLKCALDDPWTGTQTGVVLPETGSKNDKAADGSAPVVRSVTVYVGRVWFTEDSNQKYGFDDWSNKGRPKEIPWKSVGIGQTDTVDANTSPTPAAPGVYFDSGDAAFEVTPTKATTAKQRLTINGLLQARADHTPPPNSQTITTDGPTLHAHSSENITAAELEAHTLGKLFVAVYKVRNIKIGLAVVHRKSDDVQNIAVGGGDPSTPNQVCIGPGADGVLDTRPNEKLDATLAGDDTIVGSSITTGPDGVCQSTASHNGIKIDRQAVENYMNKVYKQAVFNCTVVDLGGKIVDYDIGNRDKYLEFWPWENPEQKAIFTAFESSGTFAGKNLNKVVFSVRTSTDKRYAGVADYNKRYAFVFPADLNGSTADVLAAHEVGHSFNLHHTQEPSTDVNGNLQLALPLKDVDNIMHPIVVNSYRLRVHQWEILNPDEATTVPTIP